ncbi:MAG: rhodanese-like domain-containing protein [Candidatus Omnitrophota bacterium]
MIVVLIQPMGPRTPGECSDNLALKNEELIPEHWKDKYGISFKEVAKLNGQVFFIDAREPEEFAYEHIKGAKHIRARDIDSIETIKKAFNLSDKEFKQSFFIIYCHTGTRAAEIPAKVEVNNIKFLLKGGMFLRLEENQHLIYRDLEQTIFDVDLVNEGFSISIDRAIELLRKREALFIDGRLYKKNPLPFAYDFRIGQLSTREYEQRLTNLLNFIDKKIIYIADSYADVYYAKLLVQRLRKQYAFKIKNYFVLFKKSDLFYRKLKDLNLLVE